MDPFKQNQILPAISSFNPTHLAHGLVASVDLCFTILLSFEIRFRSFLKNPISVQRKAEFSIISNTIFRSSQTRRMADFTRKLSCTSSVHVATDNELICDVAIKLRMRRCMRILIVPSLQTGVGHASPGFSHLFILDGFQIMH